MSLFQTKTFVGHAGGVLNWKIDCDYLNKLDIQALAKRISDRVSYGMVYGIPSGGMALADALMPYCRPMLNKRPLIVDDVMTTGKSMLDHRAVLIKELGYSLENIIGIAIFGRRSAFLDPELSWVKSMFVTSSWVEDDGPNPFD